MALGKLSEINHGEESIHVMPKSQGMRWHPPVAGNEFFQGGMEIGCGFV